jgi:Do/DeqQ family serine protease
MTKLGTFLGIFAAAIFGGAIALMGYVSFIEPSSLAGKNAAQTSDFLQANYQKEDKKVKLDITPQPRTSFTEAAHQVTPTVVHIRTFSTKTNPNNPRMNDMLREFFGDSTPIPENDGQRVHPQGSGSGVIISENGYIVTNNHVIDDAESISVVLDDKRTYEAELIGTDPTTDLALLKIEEAGLAYLAFGNSDVVQVGEWVLAVGNPFDLTSTVTAGIVSAKARNINILRNAGGYAIESFIQTDAAVNPGNSGGALVNTKGELIGINSAIATKTGSFSGYSFAIPSQLVEKVINDLKEFGEVQRGLLGIRIQNITPEIAQAAGLDKIQGIYVSDVGEESAAKEAKIQTGDVITHINDKAVNSSSELQELVARHRPGVSITVQYLRNGKQNRTEAVLRNRLGSTQLASRTESNLKINTLGGEFRTLTQSEEDELGTKGIKIVKVTKGRLQNAGVPKDFVITHLDKEQIVSPEQLKRSLQDKKGAVLIEGIKADGQRAFYAVGF